MILFGLVAFENAVERLGDGLARYAADRGDTQIRDGLIHRFELAYELGHRTLTRYLDSISPTPGLYDGMAFADIIRSANEAGLLLGDWRAWRGYRDMRAKTSHTYDEATALEVVAGIPAFLAEVTVLRDRLRARLA